MKILLDSEEVRRGVAELAAQIEVRYASRPLTIIGILTGSIVVLADLIRLLHMPLRVGVIQASSYRGTQRGELTIHSALMPDIQGRDVLLVDDIFDTGHTLQEVARQLQAFEPRSLEIAVLLRKVGRQEVELEPDFVGFDIPDEFVVGYGLDYRDEYRNLSYVAALEPADLREPPR